MVVVIAMIIKASATRTITTAMVIFTTTAIKIKTITKPVNDTGKNADEDNNRKDTYSKL